MRYYFLFVVVCAVSLFACRRDNQPQNPTECAIPAVVPFQPYSDPVWYPDGNLLGFNHTPLAEITSNGTAPCVWYSYQGKADSIGFYLMNKNGIGFKRATDFKLTAPSWSPDGNWIAFSLGSNIYKMPFNGSTFDTARMVQLTNAGGNFYPSWTANSDSIYFDSNVGSANGAYSVWKMAADGSGKMGFPNTGRQPFVGSDNRIYFLGVQAELFAMDKNGANPTQLTFNGNANGTLTTKSLPKYYHGKVFYQQNGLWFTSINSNNPQRLLTACQTYAISANGEIVYGMFDFGKLDREWGTFWIMNADGTNKRQLTFNHY